MMARKIALAERILDPREELMIDGVVNLDQAASMLGVCKRTVQNLMDEGKLSYTRIRSQRRIPRLAIIRYLAANLVEARQ